MNKQKVKHKGQKVKSKDRKVTSKSNRKYAENNKQQGTVKIFDVIVKKQINDIKQIQNGFAKKEKQS